jgi:Xaa-Pro aminopeptidase
MNQEIFDQEFFINNRKKLRSLFMGTAPIILSANGLLQQNSDNTYPFRQDSSFWYFTGINLPGLILVIDKDSEYLIAPKRSSFSEVADGVVDNFELTKISGIEKIFDEVIGWKKIANKLLRVKHVAVLPQAGAYIEDLGFYTNPAREALLNRIKSINQDVKLLDISGHISRLRSIKQGQEIKAITRAIEITENTFKVVKKKIGSYDYEYQIEATILAEFRKENSIPAYASIVASGINACTLHYNQNNSPINKKDLVLIDIGASVSNYAADITRTLVAGDGVSRRQQQVMNSVIEVQKYAISLIKPGIELKDYEAEIEVFMGEQLRSLGLINSVTPVNVRRYYSHSTSHFLGLDPHDAGDYNLPLETNMVLTIEPGIYIPEENIGIRIEDDFIVTEKGVVQLSHNLPPTLN